MAFTTNIINPIVARFQGGSSEGLGVQLGKTGNAKTFVDFGAFISAVIYFIIIIAVVYFLIVVPDKHVQARRGQVVFGLSGSGQDLPGLPVQRSARRRQQMQVLRYRQWRPLPDLVRR